MAGRNVEADIILVSEPVSQPREAARNFQHYGNNAGDENDARIRQSELFSSRYRITHPNLGQALVVSNVRFEPGHLADRIGSDADASNIYQRLQELGFDVDLLCDEPHDRIVAKLNEIAEMDHSENDCFVCVIMSHGDADGIWATDRKIDLKLIMKLVNTSACKSLIGKPKVFFIEASRGEEVDKGQKITVPRDTDQIVPDSGDDNEESMDHTPSHEDILVVPDDMDFLLVYSSAEGRPSYRATGQGTPFIEALSEQLRQLTETGESKDIYTLLHNVNETVALRFYAADGGKQMPCFVSTLRKSFFLKKKTH